MQINMNDNFYRIDILLTPIIGINWLEVIGEEKYFEIINMSNIDIKKSVQNPINRKILFKKLSYTTSKWFFSNSFSCLIYCFIYILIL